MISYKQDLADVDWLEMKATLVADDFDNGRTPDQLAASFAASFATCIAYGAEGQILGTARALSDGVCNAYVVDVWTYTPYRKQGIASQMMALLMNKLSGQHIYLFTDDAVPFYEKLDFAPQGVGLGRVAGRWLDPGSN